MKTDTYTKVILTVIAVALTVNVIKDLSLVPTVQASETITNNVLPSSEYRLVPISTMETLDVRIVDINTYDAKSLQNH